MTYDELYRKVEGLWHDSFKHPSWKIIWDIVKLHKPIVNALPDETCLACQDLYPCQTIQIIEKGINEKRKVFYTK